MLESESDKVLFGSGGSFGIVRGGRLGGFAGCGEGLGELSS